MVAVHDVKFSFDFLGQNVSQHFRGLPVDKVPLIFGALLYMVVDPLIPGIVVVRVERRAIVVFHGAANGLDVWEIYLDGHEARPHVIGLYFVEIKQNLTGFRAEAKQRDIYKNGAHALAAVVFFVVALFQRQRGDDILRGHPPFQARIGQFSGLIRLFLTGWKHRKA